MSKEIKRLLLAKRNKQAISRKCAVSTGSTLLNLACTDRPDVGFAKGAYYYMVGDSTSGKTWLSLSCFAEACRNPAFDGYRFVFDDVEGGAIMDVEHYFGKKVASKIETPSKHGSSTTVETFYYNLHDLLQEGNPFIYVLDSQDALSSDAAADKFAQQRKAAAKGLEAAGSYGDGKAKYHSEHIREVLAGLRDTGSILLIIGQTRDNLGTGFERKTRSGGKALRFFANLEIWTSVAGRIKKKVRGKTRTVGVQCLAEVKKNRVTGKIGKDRSAVIPIHYGLGIDDVASCVEFLIEERHWTKKGGKFDAHDILTEGTREQLVQYVEENDLEEKVREITAKVWKDVEKECIPNRKRRYE